MSTSPIQAGHHSDSIKPFKVILLKDIELTAEQKFLIRSFRAEYQYQNTSNQVAQEPQQPVLMELILLGEISIEEAHEELDRQLDIRFELYLTKAQLALKLLDSYSLRQKEQVSKNLTFVQARADDKKSAIKKIAQADYEHFPLTEGVELTRSEKKISSKLKQLHIQHRFDAVEQIQALSLEDYFLGTTDDSELIEELEYFMEERRELAHQRIDLWSVFVSEFTEEEKDLVQSNLKRHKMLQNRDQPKNNLKESRR